MNNNIYSTENTISKNASTCFLLLHFMDREIAVLNGLTFKASSQIMYSMFQSVMYKFRWFWTRDRKETKKAHKIYATVNFAFVQVELFDW